ncbi:MAG TPA: LytTR family DNA-binding domain-containing protein [Kofleriaceae bacterium]|nr:LytTR family DNA-binding domain-containing protein [Kofleriaceae bacterium]
MRDGERTVFLSVDELEWMSGAENYVELHLRGAAKDAAPGYLLQVTMNALERALDPDRFLRIHRSVIVQVGCIVEARPGASGEYFLTMQSGARLRSGRTYHPRMKRLLQNPF